MPDLPRVLLDRVDPQGGQQIFAQCFDTGPFISTDPMTAQLRTTPVDLDLWAARVGMETGTVAKVPVRTLQMLLDDARQAHRLVAQFTTAKEATHVA